jgi:hypothetical protein
MQELDKTKDLELRIVELENRLQEKDSQLSNIIIKRCINECGPCGPCACDRLTVAASVLNMARFAELTGLFTTEFTNELVEKTTQGLTKKR